MSQVPPDDPPSRPASPPGTPEYSPSAGKTNGLAIASLVLGIVGILIQLFGIVPILAIVLGFVGKNQIDQSGGVQRGRGMAIAGIVLGIIGIVLLIILLIALQSGGFVFGG
ncbi:hypothetical protein BH20ACT24_BH20ACT24_01840 [soil metagenome]